MKRPNISDEERERRRERLRALNLDAAFKEANSKRIKNLHGQKTFKKKIAETSRRTMTRLRKDPEFERKRNAGLNSKKLTFD